MEQSNLFNDRYFLERLLGRGNFSEVWLAKDEKTGVNVALKIYAPATGLDDAGLDVLAREFSLVINANHKNLLKPLHYDTCDRKPFLVLPFCAKGSIMKDVGKFTEKDAWRLLRDVAAGLAWLHGMNPPVIHQDIKPDNVMVGDGGEFMITDFGVSTHVRSTLRKSMSAAFSSAGTIAYMAPERFGKDNTPIMANDIYSLGATTYEMLTGDTPFGDDGGLLQKKGADIPELKGDFSPQLKEVIARCLNTQPWRRPTAEQLEKWAEDGLEGREINFEGKKKKSFWAKYAWIFIAGAIAVAAAIAIPVAVTRHDRKMEAEQEAVEREKTINNLIKAEMAAKVALGDSLRQIGLYHDEGFEVPLLEAEAAYKEALALAERHPDGDNLKKLHKLGVKLIATDSLLYDAYEQFMAKAELFADDREVADEFNDRARSISDVIDVNAFNKDKE